MKITKIQDSITVVFNDGTLLTKRHASPEMYEAILINQFNEEAVSQIMAPMYGDSKAAIELRIDMLENYDKSEYLTVVGSSVYITSIVCEDRQREDGRWGCVNERECRKGGDYL